MSGFSRGVCEELTHTVAFEPFPHVEANMDVLLCCCLLCVPTFPQLRKTTKKKKKLGNSERKLAWINLGCSSYRCHGSKYLTSYFSNSTQCSSAAVVSLSCSGEF